MIEFDWYIRRARINLNTLFKVENIKSDEDLLEYCKRKNLSPPLQKYFLESKVSYISPSDKLEPAKVESAQEIKIKKTARNEKAPQTKKEEPTEATTPPKKTTTRTRTRKRTTRSKSKSE